MDKPKTMLLAIVFISGGSTYYSSDKTNKEEMAATVVKRAIKDWKDLFKFKKNALWPVHFYDITNFDGWSADYSGKVTELGTNKEAKFLETLKVLH
tara:strand:+ start:2124 stop:2411 length:288 start_codon:yes stop_codon:yes gene_type:complete